MSKAPSTHPAVRRRYLPGLFAILVVATACRLIVAYAMPVISRDGVDFCWYARDLGQTGFGYLKLETTRQHPLFPTLILAVHALMGDSANGGSPLRWQLSGQIAALMSGLLVVAISAGLARSLVRKLELPLNADAAGLFSGALAAALPLNVSLSADVMTDQLHLACYLGGVWALVCATTSRHFVVAGMLAGLAFLTRPEGLIVAVAGATVAARDLMAPNRRGRAAVALLALIVGLSAVAGPYLAIVGRLTPKKDLFAAAEFEPALVAVPPPANVSPTPCHRVQARLQTEEHAWYALIPEALLKTIRAGRVIIPLAALLPILQLRRRMLAPPLLALTTCFAAHLALITFLLAKWHYLDPRHTLVLIGLLIPLAAMLLARVHGICWPQRRGIWFAVQCVVFLPLAYYSFGRIPNALDGVNRAAADWLSANDPGVHAKLIVGGHLQKRIAFYADARWAYFLESPDDFDRIRGEIVTRKADYFAIETKRDTSEHDFERDGNTELIANLRSDSEVGPRLRECATFKNPRGDVLHLFELNWSPLTTTQAGASP